MTTIKAIYGIEFFIRRILCKLIGHHFVYYDLPKSQLYQCKICGDCFK